MKCTYEHWQKRIPDKEKQSEITGREEEKKGSRAIVYLYGDPGCRTSKDHTFF